jgi:alpha-glucosidase
MLDPENTKVLSWMRNEQGSSPIVVACNFTADTQTVNLTAGGTGLKGTKVKTLLRSPGGSDPSSLQAIQLGPFGVYIGQVIE